MSETDDGVAKKSAESASVWQLGTAIADEVRTLSAEEFAAKHPGVAVVVESHDASRQATSGVHPAARITWCTDASEGVAIRIGRDPTWARVVLPHPRISKQHATIARLDGNAKLWSVTDHGSTNGTVLRGLPLAANEVAPLGDGEALVLGGIVRARFFFDPERLHATLKAKPVTTKTVRRVTLERLETTLRSLGFSPEYREAENAIVIQNGEELVRVTIETSIYAVEWGRGGRALQRRTCSAFSASSENEVRDIVLDFLGFKKPPEDPMAETHAD